MAAILIFFIAHSASGLFSVYRTVVFGKKHATVKQLSKVPFLTGFPWFNLTKVTTKLVKLLRKRRERAVAGKTVLGLKADGF